MTTTNGRGQAGEHFSAEQARYKTVQESAEFQELRSRYRSWVIPVTIASLAWYFLYVLLAAYAEGFMSNQVIGNINIGLVLGLLQFVSTFAVTAAYVKFAGSTLDPIADKIRADFEAGR